MAHRRHWILNGRKLSGFSLSEDDRKRIAEAIESISAEVYDTGIDHEFICEFMTCFNADYDDVVNTVAECSRKMPVAVFKLELHDEDEEWYQNIHFRNGEYEMIDGYIAFDEPKQIHYD